MAIQPHTAALGFKVLRGISFLSQDGVPGVSQESIDAEIGSFSSDNLTGIQYRKKIIGSGTNKWVSILDSDNGASGDSSWREEADVRDTTAYANLAAAEVALNTGSMDGVALADQDRVLLENVTGSNKNVYIVSGVPGAGATLIEDTNLATNSDRLYVASGTSAGNEYTYNSVSDTWNRSNQTTLDELGAIRAFIGKGASGTELTSYSSQVYVTNGDPLEAAIGTLDGQASTNSTNITLNASAITNAFIEIDLIESGLGSAFGATGLYAGFSGTGFIDGNGSLSEDLTDLDAELTVQAAATTALQLEVDGIETALGAMVDAAGDYQAFTGSNYMDAAADVASAMLLLDAQAASNASGITANGLSIINLGTEVDNIETALGGMIDASGNFVAFTGTTYLDGVASATAAFVELDIQVAANAADILALQNANGDESFIRAFIGKDAAGSETPTYPSAEVVTQSTPLEAAIGELDAFLFRNRKEVSVTTVAATSTVIDSELVDSALTVEWLVHVRDTVSGFVNSSRVQASHDGHAGADATATDAPVSPITLVGDNVIAGIDYTVGLVGAGAAQEMQLSVIGDNVLDVVSIRRILI